jgi:hypothetical protein
MASVPDRTKANMAILADTAANGSPSFPFPICHHNGYFALTPAIEYTPAVLKTEITLTFPEDLKTEHNYGYEHVIASIPDRGVLIGMFWLAHYGTGWGNAPTSRENYGGTRRPAGTYRMVLTAVDKDNLNVGLFEMCGTEVGNTTLTVTDLFAGNPVVHFGYPTKAILAASTGNVNYSMKPCEGAVVESVARWDETPITAITLSNNTIPASKTNLGHEIIGTLFASHPTQLRGFRFTQTGITNPFLQIVGDEIQVASYSAAGLQTITVRAYDDFGRYADQAFTITITA